jgi:HicB family
LAQPYKGVRVPFTVRIPADLHRAAAVQARNRRRPLNDIICAALAASLQPPTPVGERTNITIYDNNGNPIGRQ